MSSEPSASPRCQRTYDKVVRQVERLVELGSEPDERLNCRAEETSAWSVADHLCHLAKSNKAMAETVTKLLAPAAQETGGSLSLIGRAVLLTGWIPRGRGKAPESTRPEPRSGDELRRELLESKRAVDGLQDRLAEIERARGRVTHFAFGGLTPFLWLRVMDIHTRHHLKIIGDIKQAAGSPWRSS